MLGEFRVRDVWCIVLVPVDGCEGCRPIDRWNESLVEVERRIAREEILARDLVAVEHAD